jgi:molecular chaperone DnaK
MASIGIDLGTTNSVVARLENGRAVPILIDGSPIVPSIVLFDGERVIVGREARNLELLHPERTVRSVKRRMGTSFSYTIGGRTFLPEEISSEILRALKVGAEKAIGEPVSDVVVTVPAYFDDAQRRATLRAGELAGLNVLRLLNEPTSASLCYAQTGVADGSTQIVGIYDLGGGTFDVSVLEVFEGVREVRATTGNTALGGDDFDDKIVGMFLEDIKKRDGVDPREDPRAMARLRRVAEDTKIRLSTETRVHVREEFVTRSEGRAIHLDVEVTRRTFEGLIRSLLESTIELAKKAVLDAGLTGESLSRICLVGGSTRIPLVRSLLDEAFGVPVHEEIDADLAVGLGASIQAAMLRGEKVDRVLVDVAAHTLGIRVIGEEDDEFGEPDTFAPILRRNTVLPAVRTEEFYTATDRQEQIDVEVFQGEAARVSENTPVGSFLCPLEPRPSHSPLNVEFAYDLNGVVKATVSQPGSSTSKTVALSVADAGRATQADDIPAALVEKKAEKLLESMPAAERGALEELLARFRSARGATRTEAEEALLDFFVDYDGGENEEVSMLETPPPA